MNVTIKEAQLALAEAGFDPGWIDGVAGRRTQEAIRRFQAARGLAVTGVLDPGTVAQLMGDLGARAPLPWMAEALRVHGLHETRDKGALSKWLKSDGATVGDPARVPWCGDFVQTAIALSLPKEPLPENPYLAANWCKFGVKARPQWGAVLVFWRGSPSSWKGHVGFYAGEDATSFRVMGGNQSNAVTFTRIAKNRLRDGGCRWPDTFPDPNAGPLRVDLARAAMSQNEA